MASQIDITKRLFDEAKRYIPGGVNSPVRSFKAVGGYPVFVKRASASRLYGECGRDFIDYCLSWGALILGHANEEVIHTLNKVIRSGTSFGTVTKKETELARLIVDAIPSVEQVRLTNSGTEAVMGAIRLARAYTKKDKIIKFEGAYHGHADYLLVKAGSGQASLGIPASLGVPKDFTKQTIVLPFNDIKKVKEAVKRFQKDSAAIIVEPIMANCGIILPKEGFLRDLRKLASKYNIVLIFDEVITGFRLSYSGAQGYFGISPDLTCLGKIIGGGLPVGAFGGKRAIMRLLAPEGSVYQAGTLSGNPVAVSAGIATLNILKKTNPYSALQNNTKELCESIAPKRYKLIFKVNYIGSMFNISFADIKLFKRFFHGLLKRGVYISPSWLEANFLSTAHTAQDTNETADKMDETLKELGRR